MYDVEGERPTTAVARQLALFQRYRLAAMPQLNARRGKRLGVPDGTTLNHWSSLRRKVFAACGLDTTANM